MSTSQPRGLMAYVTALAIEAKRARDAFSRMYDAWNAFNSVPQGKPSATRPAGRSAGRHPGGPA